MHARYGSEPEAFIFWNSRNNFRRRAFASSDGVISVVVEGVDCCWGWWYHYLLLITILLSKPSNDAVVGDAIPVLGNTRLKISSV